MLRFSPAARRAFQPAFADRAMVANSQAQKLFVEMLDISELFGQMKEDFFCGRTDGLAEKAKELRGDVEEFAPQAVQLYQELLAQL